MRELFGRLFGSVRVRVTVAATLVFGLAFVVASIALVHTVQSSLEARTRQEGEAAVRQAALRIERGAPPSAAFATGSPVVGWVVGADGRVLFSTLQSQPRTLPFDAGMTAAGIAGDAPRGDVIFSTQEVAGPNGRFTVAIASPLEAVRRSVDTLGRALWFVTPLLMLLVGALAWFISGRALRPVEAMRAEALAISHESMHRRLPVPANKDELQRLATTMNEMLDRLESASTRQREFVSDASHELRSPVASMRADLEVGLAHPDGTDWPALGERVLAENERLGSLVDDLLALARLDESGATDAGGEIDVEELVFEDVARRNGGLRYDTSAVSAGRVHGQRRQLAQVVRNLVDNASRHARTTVAVRVTRDDDRVVLVVEDDGPGIDGTDCERVFERFTRLDAARARDAGGAGLGLAVVRRIAEQHHGTVHADRAPDLGGARFEVSLPAT